METEFRSAGSFADNCRLRGPTAGARARAGDIFGCFVCQLWPTNFPPSRNSRAMKFGPEPAQVVLYHQWKRNCKTQKDSIFPAPVESVSLLVRITSREEMPSGYTFWFVVDRPLVAHGRYLYRWDLYNKSFLLSIATPLCCYPGGRGVRRKLTQLWAGNSSKIENWPVGP